jgi:hypothetical protein
VPAGSSPAAVVAHVGRPGEAHLAYAAHLLAALPSPVSHAARDPYGARAVVYVLLLDRGADARGAQLRRLEAGADPGVFREVGALMPAIDGLERRARLPVLDLALPALRLLTPAQFDVFRTNVDALVAADARIDLFEWSLQRIVVRDLERQLGRATRPRVRHHTLAPLLPHIETALSTLAYVGHDDPASAAHAFEQGRREVAGADLRLRKPEECGLAAYSLALDACEAAAPRIQRTLLTAAAACILADRRITANEAELLRATAAVLGLPMPPLLSAAS